MLTSLKTEGHWEIIQVQENHKEELAGKLTEGWEPFGAVTVIMSKDVLPGKTMKQIMSGRPSNQCIIYCLRRWVSS